MSNNYADAQNSDKFKTLKYELKIKHTGIYHCEQKVDQYRHHNRNILCMDTVSQWYDQVAD